MKHDVLTLFFLRMNFVEMLPAQTKDLPTLRVPSTLLQFAHMYSSSSSFFCLKRRTRQIHA